MESLEEFHERAFVDLMVAAPELPLLLGVPDVGGRRFPADSFADRSPEGCERRMGQMADALRSLRAYPLDSQTREQRLTTEVFEFFLEYGLFGPLLGVKGHAFALADYPVRPGTGPQSELPILLAGLHPVFDRGSAGDFVARLSSLSQVIDGLVEALREREAVGNVLPAFLVERLLGELRSFVRVDARSSLLYLSFADKLEGLDDPSEGERQRLLERAHQEIEKSLLPAYTRLIGFLEAQRAGAPKEPGLCRRPDGDAYYAFLLRAATTTEASADEIHEQGLREVESLRHRLLEGFADLGYRGQSFAEQGRALDEDPRFRHPDRPEGRTQLLAELRRTISDAEARLEPLFDLLPRASVSVETMPTFAESSRHHTYQPPAKGGARPGILQLNLSSALVESRLDLTTLCYHETYPGHHLQLAIAQEREHLPTIRRMVTFDGYIEGWAKYAEQLAWEEGLNRDPHWNLARLRRELVSTANLALDTGIHHRGWTREEGLTFFLEATGTATDFANAIVDRVAGDPAQTCSYRVGMARFLELREHMRQALGADFELRHFHRAVLQDGSLPLSVLEKRVEEAIAERGEPVQCIQE